MTIQTKYSNWIDKNWQYKQDIQIQLKKIANSNKILKLNWKNWKFKPKNQIELKYFNFKWLNFNAPEAQYEPRFSRVRVPKVCECFKIPIISTA